ncbi:pectinesterase [Colletotrichum salicis]|uniref:pectinesterase n=1 Tax=Colletotrichum salicis TaxID=1209931 RepID=A0A135U6Q1_9PEZI|nr:pectinesterase [Colletotrichum salicis]
MARRHVLLLLAGIIITAAEFAGNTSECVIVSKSSCGKHFTSIQRAIDSLPTSSIAEQCIVIHQGVYQELIIVPFRSGPLSLFGETEGATTGSSNNLVTVTADQAIGCHGNTSRSSTIHVQSPQFRMYNVNVMGHMDRAGPGGTALSSEVDGGYYGCRFTGGRKVVHTRGGRHLFARSSINAYTDLVSGWEASVWHERNELRLHGSRDGQGYIAGVGAPSAMCGSLFVFNRCGISVASGAVVRNGSYFLGRPLGGDAKVVFQQTDMSPAVNPAGWRMCGLTGRRAGNVTFGEYQNHGLGSVRPRAGLATTLENPVTLTEVLGTGYFLRGFFDASYM